MERGLHGSQKFNRTLNVRFYSTVKMCHRVIGHSFLLLYVFIPYGWRSCPYTAPVHHLSSLCESSPGPWDNGDESWHWKIVRFQIEPWEKRVYSLRYLDMLYIWKKSIHSRPPLYPRPLRPKLTPLLSENLPKEATVWYIEGWGLRSFLWPKITSFTSEWR